MIKHIEYLDLELSNYKNVSIRNMKYEFSHKCYFKNENSYTHSLHSIDCEIQNSIIDLIITQSLKLEEVNNKIISMNNQNSENIFKHNNILKDLSINIEYIKNQNIDIIKHVNHITYLKNEKIKTSHNQTKVIERLDNTNKKLEERFKHIEIILQELGKVIKG